MAKAAVGRSRRSGRARGAARTSVSPARPRRSRQASGRGCGSAARGSGARTRTRNPGMRGCCSTIDPPTSRLLRCRPPCARRPEGIPESCMAPRRCSGARGGDDEIRMRAEMLPVIFVQTLELRSPAPPVRGGEQWIEPYRHERPDHLPEVLNDSVRSRHARAPATSRRRGEPAGHLPPSRSSRTLPGRRVSAPDTLPAPWRSPFTLPSLLPVADGSRVVPRFAVVCNLLPLKFARDSHRITKEFFWRG